MQRQDASCKDRRVLAKLTFATAKAIAMVGDDALDDGALEVRRIADRLRVRLHPPVQALDWEGVVDAAIAHKLCCDMAKPMLLCKAAAGVWPTCGDRGANVICMQLGNLLGERELSGMIHGRKILRALNAMNQSANSFEGALAD